MYYIKNTDEKGKTAIVNLDDRFKVFTRCGTCGEEMEIDPGHFFCMAFQHGLHDTRWFCSQECNPHFGTPKKSSIQPLKIIK